jgi:hypothetical protein
MIRAQKKLLSKQKLTNLSPSKTSKSIDIKHNDNKK